MIATTANGEGRLRRASSAPASAGVGIGVRLAQQGISDFKIFERGDTVGGVWRANTYPGAACDVPSHLYSFSFAKGSDWSRRYAPQADILRYLEGVTERFGLGPHLHLGTEVTEPRSTPKPGAGPSRPTLRRATRSTC